MKSKLLDFFPVPKTLAMHASGVSVTDDVIQFVRFAHKNKVELEAFGEIAVPESVMEGGAVVEPKSFIALLKKIKDQHNLNLVDVSIPEEKSYLFKTKVLGENIKEIKSNIELKIPENVPFKLSEVVFDFEVLNQDPEAKERDVMVSVLPRTVAEQYLNAFYQAGLVPISFQVESQAVVEAAVPRANKKSVLVVHVKDDKASFYVVTGRVVRFSSTVDVAGGVGIQVNMLDNPLEEIGEEQGGEKVEGFDLKILLRETKKILTYWKSHETGKDATIEHIYLTGTIQEEIKTTDYMSTNISLPVEISNVWQNAFSFDQTIPAMERADSLRFAGAIGLALNKEN